MLLLSRQAPKRCPHIFDSSLSAPEPGRAERSQNQQRPQPCNTMSRDEHPPLNMESPRPSGVSSFENRALPARMQYRSRPVSVAVDPLSLVISECISITSAIQKHARSPHSSVSAILGGSPNPLQLDNSCLQCATLLQRSKSPAGSISGDGSHDGLTNRWGLRGQRGKSMQDNPMIAGFGKLRHELAGVKGTVGQLVRHF